MIRKNISCFSSILKGYLLNTFKELAPAGIDSRYRAKEDKMECQMHNGEWGVEQMRMYYKNMWNRMWMNSK